MNREEAIKILENEKACVNRANKNDYCNRDCYNCELVKTDTEILNALDMAIEALQTEPCENCIRRQAAIDIDFKRIILTTAKPAETIKQKVKALPSVQKTVCIAKISFDDQQMKEMMDKAISNLDFSGLISRQAAIDELVRWGAIPEYNEAEKNILACCIGMLSTLPSVQPEPKMGKWIIIDDCERFIAKCSECGRIEDSRMISKYPYCHCGAKMQEVEE